MRDYDLIVVLGPTASGKTQLAANIAYYLGGEIISADSRQVYKGMDIGTGKDYDDYIVNGQTIKYHLIDILEPGQTYDVFNYQRDFSRVYKEIRERNRIPVLCGGTGLYIEAVTGGYRMPQVPENSALRRALNNKDYNQLLDYYYCLVENPHNITDITDRDRLIRAIEIAEYSKEHDTESYVVSVNPVFLGVYYERPEQKQRIKERLLHRLKNGMIEEVKQLREKGISTEMLDYYGLEYRYISYYLTGEMDYDTMVERLNIAIRQFAKKQMTWFRRMERKGYVINWLKGEWTFQQKLHTALEYL